MDLLYFFCFVFVVPLCASILFVPCGHLLGNGLTFWLTLTLWCITVSSSLSHWYHGSGVVMIVSVPDLCTLTYFLNVTVPKTGFEALNITVAAKGNPSP